MSDKFGEGRDPYLYSGLKVMRNRLGIRQAQRLEQAAWDLTMMITKENLSLKTILKHFHSNMI